MSDRDRRELFFPNLLDDAGYGSPAEYEHDQARVSRPLVERQRYTHGYATNERIDGVMTRSRLVNWVLDCGFTACHLIEDFAHGHVVILVPVSDCDPPVISGWLDHLSLARPLGVRMTLLRCTSEQYLEHAQLSAKDAEFSVLMATVAGQEIP